MILEERRRQRQTNSPKMLAAIPISNPLTKITVSFTTSDRSLKAKNKPLTSPKPSIAPTLKSLAKSCRLDEALHLIESSPFKPCDLEAYSIFLHACISTKSLEHGQRLYLKLLLSKDDKNDQNLLRNSVLKKKFITLYTTCGRVDDARAIFEDGLGDGNVPESLYVAMAIGYLRNGFYKEALGLYVEMLSKNVGRPGNFAFSMALKASALTMDLWFGRSVHAQIVKSDEKPDQVVYNALLRLYSDGGAYHEIIRVFEEMPERNVVSWNSLIAGFVGRNQVFESLDTFRRMQREEGMGFTWITFTTILPICARITAINCGKEIHAQMVKSERKPDVLVTNALMDMYAKCGAMSYCRKVFEGMHCKDLTSWNTLLMGYAINGQMTEAMGLFDEMVCSGQNPDGITFVSLISGCSHAGLADVGQRLFETMESEYGISPNLEHYACLVDILGRAGRIGEAIEVVKNMPMKPSGSIWGSLLNSCRLHGNVSLAEFVAKRLFEIEPLNPGNYVILSNIYANARLWDGVKMVRELMERRGIKKEAGCSWLQVRNRFHTFVAGGSHEFRNSPEYKKVWDELMEGMEEAGYVPDTSVVLHDVNEDVKASWVCGHSERLATMFALIHTGSQIPIRITKNLRVCTDCHSWMKIVSRVTGRAIVLRDTNRFHHFDEGLCSCQDYW